MRIAYLIVVHNQFELLNEMISVLDSPNADFYIHVDKKAKSYENTFQTKHSKVYHVKNYNVQWGGYSMILAELELFKAAFANGYDYYHLISGADFPIKSKEFIEEYSFRNRETILINFEDLKIKDKYIDRVKYYYLFQDASFSSKIIKKIFVRIDDVSVAIQKILKINRIKDEIECSWQKGANWFSCNHEVMGYIISHENKIKNTYKYTRCADEMFVQTLLFNSPYKHFFKANAFNDDHSSSGRYIDWNRGRPYVFKENDFDELIHASEDYLFARKFSIGNECVFLLKNYLLNREDK